MTHVKKGLEIYDSITTEEFNKFSKEGWTLSLVDSDRSIEVQRIDDVEDWKYVHNYDFDIPKLESDDEALRLASKYFVFDGFEVVKRKKTSTKLSLEGREVKVSAELAETAVSFGASMMPVNKFKVTAEANGKTADFEYFCSHNDYLAGKTELDDEDLKMALACFMSDAICGDMSFQEFCEEFGYNNDSISHLNIWKYCQESLTKSKGMFDDLYEATNEIERNE